MTKRSIKLLAVTIFSLLLFGAGPRANAAPSGKDEGGPVIPQEVIQISFLVVLAVTGLAVLVGTGKSIKYSDTNESEAAEGEENHIAASGQRYAEEEHEIAHGEFDSDHNLELDEEEYEPVIGRSDRGSIESDDINYQDVAVQSTSLKDLEVATSKEQLLELQQKLYRQKYQKLQQEVKQSPDFKDSPTKEIDTWEVDVEVALRVLAESPTNKEEVEKVLLQSDQVRQWEALLPEQEYRSKAREYIEKAYNWAQDLRKWREKHVSA
ncbi:MAG: hypothetical protein QNJ54_09980 [Prochloraceae cyanobacterium]|nr:hypothetical protein [Prochloraceae cyanobacterium]